MSWHGPPAPYREITTDWGTLYAESTRPDSVRFTTSGARDRPKVTLTINGVAYFCGLTLAECDDTCTQGWHRVGDGPWHCHEDTLKRDLSWRNPTKAAQALVTHILTPILADWLKTADAKALRTEGDQYWRATMNQHADAAQAIFTDASNHVEELRAAVNQGEILSAADERYLRRLRVTDRHY